MKQDLQTITIGGGCFWCVEAQFKALKGVHLMEPGYMGGTTENPTYEQVCTGATGHAEVLRVHYDPEIISFEMLVYLFFQAHDPTQLNRQGNDIGTQYRSIIFYKNEQEKESIEKVIRLLQSEDDFYKGIVTQIEKEGTFYVAENHHFNYYSLNPEQTYCKYVIAPKVEHFQQKLKEIL